MIAMVQHLWQSTLLGLWAALLMRLLRKNAASTRYWIGWGASVKFLLPFSVLAALGRHWSELATLFVPRLPESVTAVAERIALPFGEPNVAYSAAPFLDGFSLLVMIVWLAGFLFVLCRWCQSVRKMRAIIRSSTPYTGEFVDAGSSASYRECRGPRESLVPVEMPVTLATSPHLTEPCVAGFFRPVLLLPRDIGTYLTKPQLRAVLAHELEHVRRHDNLLAAVHTLVTAVFWFHPLVWWLGARLMEDREDACDQAVLDAGHEPVTYAEGLLSVARVHCRTPMVGVAGASGANLKRRIQIIANGQPQVGMDPYKKLLLGITLLCALAGPVSAGMTFVPSVMPPLSPHLDPLRFNKVFMAQVTGGGDTALSVANGRLSMRNLSLRDLVGFAYGVDRWKVAGSWLETPHYDIEAAWDPKSVRGRSTDPVAYRALITALLSDRFNLRIYMNGHCQFSCDAPVPVTATQRN